MTTSAQTKTVSKTLMAVAILIAAGAAAFALMRLNLNRFPLTRPITAPLTRVKLNIQPPTPHPIIKLSPEKNKIVR